MRLQYQHNQTNKQINNQPNKQTNSQTNKLNNQSNKQTNGQKYSYGRVRPHPAEAEPQYQHNYWICTSFYIRIYKNALNPKLYSIYTDTEMYMFYANKLHPISGCI